MRRKIRSLLSNKKVLAGGAAGVVGLALVAAVATARSGWLGSEEPQTLGVSEVNEVESLSEQEAMAILELFTDDVRVMRPDETEFRPGVDGEELPVGTEVKTGPGGRAQVLYANKSVTRIDFNSEMVIESLGNAPFEAEVQVRTGNIWSRVAILLGQERYETTSSNLVASIRGTSYGHTIMDNGHDTILVSEGLVAGECFEVEQAAEVGVGEKASYPCGDGGSVVQRRLNQSELADEWYLFNVEKDRELDQRFGAGTYRADSLSSPIPTSPSIVSPSPSASPRSALIDCTGPDGMVSRATQEECDNLNNFWQSQQPTPTPTPNQESTNNNPTPTPSPTPSPIPTLDTRLMDTQDFQESPPPTQPEASPFLL